MCISDYRIGRLIRSNTRVANLTSTGTFAVEANPNRVGVIIAAAIPSIIAAGYVTVTIGGAIVTYVFSSYPVFTLLMKDHGDMPTKSILLTSVGITVNVSVTELILPYAELSSALNEFKLRL